MNVSSAVDVARRRRSPAAMPGYHTGRPPRNKGLRYPADPPRVEEIIAVMRHAGPGVHGDRTRGLIVVLWRSGLRIAEALELGEADLGDRRGALLGRHGKGDKRREVGMDEWDWEQLRPWSSQRERLPVGRLFCVIEGPTSGRPWTPGAVRTQLRRLAKPASSDAGTTMLAGRRVDILDARPDPHGAVDLGPHVSQSTDKNKGQASRATCRCPLTTRQARVTRRVWIPIWVPM